MRLRPSSDACRTIARDVDRKLRLAAKPHAALSLWQFDEGPRLERVG